MVDGFYKALNLITINVGHGFDMSLDRVLNPVVE